MEEEKDAFASVATDSDGDFTEIKYLLYGLDLEEQQYVLAGLLLDLVPNAPKA